MIMNSSLFSSAGNSALVRNTEPNEYVPYEQVWSEAHKKICLQWIKQNGYKRVCLQFPDSLLPHSVVISESLQAAFSATEIFILADTSYGSCCVDEIAAAHIDSDSLIHFGNACKSKVSRLPVLYMLPELNISVEKMVAHLRKIHSISKNKHTCIYLDIGYHHLLEKDFEVKIHEVIGAQLHVKAYPSAEGIKDDREKAIEELSIFVGGDNSRFFNLSLSLNVTDWFIYDPVTDVFCKKNALASDYIRRRYFYIEKCKEAKTLGIIVATLTATDYLKAIARIQEMAKCHGTKTQIISVGRINPEKLANFLEIDCYVLIGCPLNNMYTSKEFYKPIVSVFEAEMALNPAWKMKYPETYETDFREILPSGRSFMQFHEDDVFDNEVSLISGMIRNSAERKSIISNNVVSQIGKNQLMTKTGLTFEDRSWKGLDPALGCSEPAKVQKGLVGIPIKYSYEK